MDCGGLGTVEDLEQWKACNCGGLVTVDCGGLGTVKGLEQWRAWNCGRLGTVEGL